MCECIMINVLFKEKERRKRAEVYDDYLLLDLLEFSTILNVPR